jgi:hypothetical protein
MTQGEAVFQAVMAQIDGDIVGRVELNKAQLEAVHEAVFLMFKTGETTHKSNPDDAALKKYIPGLVNNWLRKDKRLNGGVKYETKNPGSRSGSGDESVKAMRTLLAMTSDPAAKQAIQVEIDKRVAELKPKLEINIDALPEALRALVPQKS